MSHREMVAGIQLAGSLLVVMWLVHDLTSGGLVGASVAEVATRLLWLIGTVIVFAIIATIVGTIAVSAAQRVKFRDEPADERDVAINARSQRLSAIVTSTLAALALFPLAQGADPVFAAYALFIAPMVGGTVDAAARLYYYRTN